MKIPAHLIDSDLERDFLACLAWAMQRQKVELVADALEVEGFADPTNRQVFEQMREVYLTYDAFSWSLLRSHLLEQGQEMAPLIVGIVAADWGGTSDNLPHLARRLQDLCESRTAYHLAMDVIEGKTSKGYEIVR